MNIEKVKAEEFKEVLGHTHAAVFGDFLPPDFFRFDYALVTFKEDSEPVSYTLIHELSSEDVEMTYGGTIDEARGVSSKTSFRLFIGRIKEMGYKNAFMQVQNINTKMLRLALSEEFIICGTRLNKQGKTFVLLTKNLEE